jgi:hypothetical protein
MMGTGAGAPAAATKPVCSFASSLTFTRPHARPNNFAGRIESLHVDLLKIPVPDHKDIFYFKLLKRKLTLEDNNRNEPLPVATPAHYETEIDRKAGSGSERFSR